jgi:cation diffusion facilitator CzcD-associated flavoprotein CzcO
MIIVGAGFAGLGMAIKLKQAGIEDFVILERAAEVGGTWRDNQYPGAACDVPSNLYSFSFAPNPEWSRSYSRSDEILNYIRYLADAYDLRRHIRFNANVDSLRFDEDAGVWRAHTDDGETHVGRATLLASGPLADPEYPNISGIDDFRGHKIHSSRWDHDYDFRGKKVAVIGTGASAVQIVPELVKEVDQLKVFQRTPAWILPRMDVATPEWNKTLFRRVPGAQEAMRKALYGVHEAMALGVVWNTPLTKLLERMARAHLHRQVKDDWLRRELTPDFTIGCKRVLMTSDYYPALQEPNCKLITYPIDRISEHGIRTAEGIEHQFDCIVFATGFHVNNQGAPIPIYGRGGRNLDAEWRGGAQAFKGTNISGYPNLFMTLGPNSGPGHNSALVYMEAQLEYALQGVQKILREDLKMLDVRPHVQKRHNEKLQKRLAKTNWNSGCSSWYLTEDGFNATMFPGFATQFVQQLKHLREADYIKA